MKSLLKALALLGAATVVLALVVIGWLGSRGISAKAEPGRVETTLARTMRRLAIPRDARNRENPVAASPEVIAAGMAHWADHCAACHANDGSGDTDMGRNMYPRAPDMRLAATQGLTDGELFWIVENGITFTGMPGWGSGTPEGETESWHLVHFIRHLPDVSEPELEEMESLNPRSPAEIRQEIEEQRFLQGGDIPQEPPTHAH